GDPARRVGVEHEPMLARLLEQRLDVRHGRLECARHQHADFGGLRIGGGGRCERRGEQRNFAIHDASPSILTNYTLILGGLQSLAQPILCAALSLSGSAMSDPSEFDAMSAVQLRALIV